MRYTQSPHNWNGIKKRRLASIFLAGLLITILLLFNLASGKAQSVITDPATPPGETIPPTQFSPSSTPQSSSDWSPPLVAQPYALGQFEHFYLSRPISEDSVNWPVASYLYGSTDSETEFTHSGLDFAAPLHTTILSTGSGKVVFAGYGLMLGKGNTEDPYGLAVVIRHDFSYYGYSILSVYAHMEEITVVEGQKVKTGETIGYVGITGNTTGPHVHFEIRLFKDGVYYVQNPLLWMTPLTDRGVFVGSFLNKYGTFLNDREVWITSLSTGKVWKMRTYFAQAASNDLAYSENIVLGDLEPGQYEIMFLNNYMYNKYVFTINPGAITYVAFKSGEGFSTALPDTSELTGFIPPNGN